MYSKAFVKGADIHFSLYFPADALISTGLADLGYIYVNIGELLCTYFCLLPMESLWRSKYAVEASNIVSIF